MTADANVLIPGQQIKAILDLNDAKRLVELRYGVKVKSIDELDAYDDRNYHVVCEEHAPTDNPHLPKIAKYGYVLKIINRLDSQKTGFIEGQNELLFFLNKKGFTCPLPVQQKDGSYYSVETLGEQGHRHVLRLLLYRRGEILSKVTVTSELLKKVGLLAARLNKAMGEFSHPAYENQTSLWMLSAVPKLREFTFALQDKNEADVAEEIISAFEQKVLTIAGSLEKGIIHGDLNENNILVSPNGTDIESVIDFGDCNKSCLVFELAICVCYMITQSNSIEMVKYVIDGYRMARQLTQVEKEILRLCVCARYIQSLVLGSYSYQREPTNHYLIRSHAVKWSFVRKLWSMSDDEVMNIWGIKD